MKKPSVIAKKYSLFRYFYQVFCMSEQLNFISTLTKKTIIILILWTVKQVRWNWQFLPILNFEEYWKMLSFSIKEAKYIFSIGVFNAFVAKKNF